MSGELQRRQRRDTARCPCSDGPEWHSYGYHDRQREYPRTDRTQGYQPGELDPEWVMAGVDVPAGKRLYASRDLKGSAFRLAVDKSGNGDGWHLTTTMQRMLVITRPTYAECLAELMRIWANWENEGRELPAGQHGERKAVT